MTPRLALLVLALVAAPSLPAAPGTVFSTEFSAPADLEANFVALKASGEALLAHDSHSAGLGLRKTGIGTLSVLFDTSAREGKNGQAGTVGSAANANLADVEISAAVRFADFNGPGLGFWSRVPADCGAGLLGLINVVAADQVRLRIFGAGSQPLSAAPGKVLKDVVIAPTLPLDSAAIYRAVFRTRTTPEGLRLELMLRDSQGTLAATDVVAPRSEAPAAGQVGLRFSSHTLILDALSIHTL